MTDARPYGLNIGRNISGARGRLQKSQRATSARMRALGFEWQQQTLAAVEKGKRRPTAEEIFGLAVALETTIAALMTASDPDGFVEFPNGMAIHSSSVERLAGRGVNDHAVQWQDDEHPLFFRYTERPTRDPFDRDVFGPAMAAQGWPEDAEPRDDHET